MADLPRGTVTFLFTDIEGSTTLWEQDRAAMARPSARPAKDIAAAVRFFCLPETEFTTGQSLLVDGGHSLYLHE